MCVYKTECVHVMCVYVCDVCTCNVCMCIVCRCDVHTVHAMCVRVMCTCVCTWAYNSNVASERSPICTCHALTPAHLNSFSLCHHIKATLKLYIICFCNWYPWLH